MNKGLVVIFVCLMLLFIPASSAIVDIGSLDKPIPSRGWVIIRGLIFKPEIKDGIVNCTVIRLRYTYINLFSGGYSGFCRFRRVTFEGGPIMGKIGLVRYVNRIYFGNLTIY